MLFSKIKPFLKRLSFFAMFPSLLLVGSSKPLNLSRQTHPLAIPAVPVLLYPTDGIYLNNATPVFTWRSVVNGDTYEIQIDDSRSFTSPLVQTSHELSGVLNYQANLLSDKTYYWRVRAYNANNQPGAWSIFRKFVIDTALPSPPILQSPADDAIMQQAPLYSWQPVTDAEQYQFQLDSHSDFSNPLHTSMVRNKITFSYPRQDYSAGVYYWHVRAVDKAGNWSDWSSYRSVDIKPLTPSAPFLISPATDVITNSTPVFSWSSASYGDSYEIQIDDNLRFNSPLVQNNHGASGVLTYTASSLLENTYYWRVRAYNTNNQGGPWSNIRSFKVDTTPPLSPVLKAPADNSIARAPATFSWNSSTSATLYQFEIDDNNDFSSPYVTPSNLTAMSYNLDFVLGTFYWHVRARDAVGNWSSWSSTRMVVIAPPPFDSAPILTSPANNGTVDNDIVTFSWAQIHHGGWYGSMHDSYTLQVDNDSDFSSPIFETSGETVNPVLKPSSISIPEIPVPFAGRPDFIPDGTYYWRIQAHNLLSGDTSPWSSVWSFQMNNTYTNCDSLIPDSGNDANYSISMGSPPGFPTIGHLTISPYLPSTGQTQTWTLTAGVKPPPSPDTSQPITSITGYLVTDHGYQTFPLNLISGDAVSGGQWQGQTVVNDTYCYKYMFYYIEDNTTDGYPDDTGKTVGALAMRNP